MRKNLDAPSSKRALTNIPDYRLHQSDDDGGHPPASGLALRRRRGRRLRAASHDADDDGEGRSTSQGLDVILQRHPGTYATAGALAATAWCWYRTKFSHLPASGLPSQGTVTRPAEIGPPERYAATRPWSAAGSTSWPAPPTITYQPESSRHSATGPRQQPCARPATAVFGGARCYHEVRGNAHQAQWDHFAVGLEFPAMRGDHRRALALDERGKGGHATPARLVAPGSSRVAGQRSR